jgi:Putative Flp pilus-assembly TadE/G-like
MGGSIPRCVSCRQLGQTLALLVFMMPAIVGAMGLAVDVANFYLSYVRLQTAADASVLSGVRYLPDQPDRAISTATSYATDFNGIAAAEIISTTTSNDATKCPAPASPCSLTMNLRRTVPFYFAALVGANEGTLNVSATAAAGLVARAINHGLVPIGLQYTTPYTNGARVTLVFSSPSSPKSAQYSWSPLALGGSTFTSIFAKGYTGKVSMNDAVAPDRSATTTGPVNTAIQIRINTGKAIDSSGSPVPPPSYTANDWRIATVALVDWGAVGGCCRIKGFAQLWLDSVSNANITGYWIRTGVNGTPDTSATVPNGGSLAISLTR